MPHVVRAAFAAAFLATCGAAQSATRAVASRPAADTRPAPRDTARERRVLDVFDEALDPSRASWFWLCGYAEGHGGLAGLQPVYHGLFCGNSFGPVSFAVTPDELLRRLKAAYAPAVDVPTPAPALKNLMDGDTFTPSVAAAADALRRLNRADPGGDVDFGAVTGDRVDCWPVPAPLKSDGRTPATSEDERPHDLRLRARTTLVYRISPDAEHAGSVPRGARDAARSAIVATLGRVALVQLPLYGRPLTETGPSFDPRPLLTPRCTLLQTAADGRKLVARSRSNAVWLTSDFDLALAFEMHADLEPGDWSVHGELRGTAP